jgi:DNA-binding transcriptional LysR family regulator
MPYGIQQPAISGQIAKLEKDLDAALFRRRPFRLTPAGERLFTEIEPFFCGLRDLANHVRGSASNHLRLAAPAIVLRDYLPKIAVRFKRRYRDFRLTLHDANQAGAEELLRKGEIDIAITELEGTPSPAINSRILLRVPLALLIPISRKVNRVQDLFSNGVAHENLISLPAEEVISKQFHSGLTKLKLAWTPTIEVASLELVELYTSLGFGLGLSVALPRPAHKGGLRCLPLTALPPLKIAALWTGQLQQLPAVLLQEINVAIRPWGQSRRV